MKAEAQLDVVGSRGWVIACQAVFIALLVILAFREVFPPLVLEWYEHENFSYGFFIPLIFLYLVWDKRDALKTVETNASPWGLLYLSVALVAGVLGQTAGEPFVSRLAFVATLGALTHLFLGSSVVRCLAFPLTYLFLMVPPPYPIVKAVSHHLKMLDAWVAELLLPVAGVPVFRDAYLLHLPNITLEVADVCSGIASLFAMTALGVLYAYYLPVNRMGQVAIFVGALILPVIANLLRIFLVGVSVYYYGPIMLGAFFHSFTGTFTFLLSLAMLLGLGEWIRRLRVFTPDAGRTSHPVNSPISVQHPLHRGAQGISWSSIPFIGAVSLLLATVLASEWSHGSYHQKAFPELSRISERLGKYEAREGKSEDFYQDPYAEVAVSRFYRASQSDEIELFLGYRSQQFGIERLRSPKLVFPAGWEYASVGSIEIQLGGGHFIDSIWVETRKGSARKVVIFWYRMRGLSFASDLKNRFEVLRGLLFHGRTDAAVVRLSTRVDESETLAQAMHRVASFAALLHPELVQLLPD